jgi:hypothetical protein
MRQTHDANQDFSGMDLDEFRARANSDLEQLLRSKHLERIVCSFFPSGTTLDDLGTMDRAQLSATSRGQRRRRYRCWWTWQPRWRSARPSTPRAAANSAASCGEARLTTFTTASRACAGFPTRTSKGGCARSTPSAQTRTSSF